MKYDGSVWTIYNDTLTFGRFHIKDIEVDSNNKLWFITQITGYTHYEEGFNVYQFDGNILDTIASGPLPNFIYYDIEPDFEGNMMVMGRYYPPIQYSYPIFEFHRFNILNFQNSKIPFPTGFDLGEYFLASTTDTIWCGSSAGLSYYTNGIWSLIDSSNSNIPVNKINCVTTDHKNNIWAGTDNGLIEYPN
ncbi:MAG: two-component regulator propeller domain-containing protein [Bacteroidota bacterium]